MYKSAVVLAAGKGKRMKSNLPKVLHKVCGKEMINQIIDTLRKSSIDDINLVIGNGAEEVKKQTENRQVTYSIQEEQLGTGHALMCAKSFLQDKNGIVAVFSGDAPLITEDTVRKFFKFHKEGEYTATILTAKVDDASGYGRIVRNTAGEVEKIVEHKDCSEEELKINEINSGMYCFNIQELLENLDKLNNNNSQGEYYLTDVIEFLKSEGHKVGAISVDEDEIKGVNSRVQLSEADEILRLRINRFHMENGVTIIDPKSTYIGADVEIGKDTTIYPGNVIQGKTIIKEGCMLYPNSRIENSIIDEGVVIQSSVILESQIGKNTTIGPFAYIRPETNIGNNVRIGDFVEVKKSTIGHDTKVSHLTYIGDAEVGSGCNFGCGTVVVNYDGKTKSKTIIGDNAFIGCNTNLVAPVEVEGNTYIAAGATITKTVPKGALAVARAKQVNIDGWVYKKKLTKE